MSEFNLPDLTSILADKLKRPTVGKEFIYVLQAGAMSSLVKIGTTDDLWGRIKKLKASSPTKLYPVMFWACQAGRTVEAALHTLFRDYRQHSEWFDFGDDGQGPDRWKFRHLALSALLTCSRPPIPIQGGLLSDIQYGHIPTAERCELMQSRTLVGRECYPPELFASFYESGEDSYDVRDWSEETLRLYGFSGHD